MRRILAILLISSSAYAVDSKSMFLGMGLGAGMFVTRNYVALPVAKATKKAVKKSYGAVFHRSK